MPAKHGGADAAAVEHASTNRDHERYEAGDKGEARHHHGPEASRAPSMAGSSIERPCSRQAKVSRLKLHL
jgi:hypothetical protein